MKMQIYVFGNEDLEMDSLPLKILPDLKKVFPEIDFIVKDPNEEWENVEELNIIDTVVGIDEIKIFSSLKDFIRSPRVSLHDFDAYTNLLFLEKLGKLKKIKIIGVPPTIAREEAVPKISQLIKLAL
jgi:hypothetical protein